MNKKDHTSASDMTMRRYMFEGTNLSVNDSIVLGSLIKATGINVIFSAIDRLSADCDATIMILEGHEWEIEAFDDKVAHLLFEASGFYVLHELTKW